MDSNTTHDSLPYREGIAVMWRSLVVNVALAVVKTSVGIAAHSQALIADGLHSFSDLSSDIAGIVGLNIASKPGDHNHPYGHYKFASLSSVVVAVFVLGFCAVLILTSAHHLREHANEVPGWEALWVALLALVVKEGFFRYAARQARKLKLRVLAASALDHRADALASLLAVVAIFAARVGGPDWAFLDKAAGLALGGYLGVQGCIILVQAFADLLDTAPDQAMINDLREHILRVPGALAYHQFRVRRVGDLYEVDLHLQVSGKLTVEAGHDIAHKVKAAILEKHPEVVELLVHVEPASPEHIKETGVHDSKV